MKTQSRIPVKDADFNNYINITTPYLTTNKTRLTITSTSQAKLSLLDTLLTAADTGWNSIYPACCNPATATTTLFANKKNVRDQIETLLRDIFADIPKSVLTQTDRDTLNIQMPSSTRVLSPVPQSVPSITVSERSHLSITLTILDVQNSQVITNVPDASVVEVETAFLPNGVTAPAGFPQDGDFHFLTTSGRSTIKRQYEAQQLKGTEYLKARYLNSCNEPGNWSEIISVTVA